MSPACASLLIRCYLGILCFLACTPRAASQYVSQTFAGEEAGDGGPGTGALLRDIQAIAVSSAGDVYLTDTNLNRVRMLNTTVDIIISVAGNGMSDFGAVVSPGMLATSVPARDADSLALHPTAGGFVFSAACSVYYVNHTGYIAFLAGTYCGNGGDNVIATETPLYSPTGISVSPTTGDIYFVEPSSYRVRKVQPNGTLTSFAGGTPVAGSGDNGPAVNTIFNWPIATAVDASGLVYVVDSGDNRVRVIYTNGTIAAFAGTGAAGAEGDGGPAISATFRGPNCIHIMSSGDTLVCDSGNSQVRVVHVNRNISVLSGSAGIPCISVGSDALGFVYIAETDRVWRVAQDGVSAMIAGGVSVTSGNGGPARWAQLQVPKGVAVDLTTNVTYIADTFNGLIRRVSPNGTIDRFAGTGTNAYGGDGYSSLMAQLSFPVSVSTSPFGDVYIADTGNQRIRVVRANGTIATLAGNGLIGPSVGYTGDGGPGTAAQLHAPAHVTVDASGNLYVTDAGSHRIRKMSADGAVQLVAGAGGASMSGDGGSALDANLQDPHGIALDGAGNIYVSDWDGCTVRCINASTGNITTVVGITYLCGEIGNVGVSTAMRLRNPAGIAVDNASRLFIADSGNHKIRVAYPNGTFATFVGDGIAQFAGDGLTGTSVSLQSPRGVAIGPNGTIYIADTGNRRIRGSAC
jgi:hypothetical protein